MQTESKSEFFSLKKGPELFRSPFCLRIIWLIYFDDVVVFFAFLYKQVFTLKQIKIQI